ncbi:MAG: hypothetical protein R3F48_09375 [Candidatus Zixiibacteriota bacterium]
MNKEKPVFSKVREFYEKHFESFRDFLSGKGQPELIPVENSSDRQKKKLGKYYIERT